MKPSPLFSPRSGAIPNYSRRRKLTILLPAVLILCLSPRPAPGQYAGGSGAPENPFLISDPNHLNAIGAHPEHWDKHFKLTADIDLSRFTGTDFNIIGRYNGLPGHPENFPFSGVFDGNGHRIFNFNYEVIKGYSIGLFGYVKGTDAKIKNLTLVDPNLTVEKGSFVGCLVGYLESGSITNCGADDGGVIGIVANVGGLIGWNEKGKVKHCFSGGYVKGSSYTGGLVGYNDGEISHCNTVGFAEGIERVGGLAGINRENGVISHCQARSNVNGNKTVGGLVGSNRGKIVNSYAGGEVKSKGIAGGLAGYSSKYHGNPATISCCWATGNIEGMDGVGGLVGSNADTTIRFCYAGGDVSGQESVGGLIGRNNGLISYCYAKGKVDGTSGVGGLMGGNYGINFLCYWDINTSGQTESAGGKGRTTAQMKSAANYQGWGYEPIWAIDEGNDYPHFIWENLPGELISTPLPTYGGGKGTEADPFEIYTAEQLNTLGACEKHWDKHFKLVNDIDLDGYNKSTFHIIGFPFTGVFEGHDYTINNFTYETTYESYVGLFGEVLGDNSIIRNLRLSDPNISVDWGEYIGSLAGKLSSGHIQGCRVDRGFVTGRQNVGGLVGLCEYGTIHQCFAEAEVTGDKFFIGGLVGYIEEGMIVESVTAGSVSGPWGTHGGLVGTNDSGTIDKCSSTSNVSGTNNGVGGLAGTNSGVITGSFASGAVEGQLYAGGLAGFNRLTQLSTTVTLRVMFPEGPTSAAWWDMTIMAPSVTAMRPVRLVAIILSAAWWDITIMAPSATAMRPVR